METKNVLDIALDALLDDLIEIGGILLPSDADADAQLDLERPDRYDMQ